MPPKRQAPPTSEPSGRRRSTRISLSGQTSQYFEGDDSDVDLDDRPGKRAKKSALASKAKNGARRQVDDSGDSDADSYKEEEDEDEEEDGDEDNEDDDADDYEEEKVVKSSGKISSKNGAKGGAKNGRKHKEESDDDSDSDAAPKVTFIPHKKLHDLGGVDYADETVHPVTMHFLKELKANNRREWLKGCDAEFRRAQKDWLSYVDTLGMRIAADADETIPELPAKDIVFRIYRDVRFSKDKRPYKPHFSAAWSRTGKKGPYACYYLHCEPGSCFVGGGLWHPENDALRLLRASIDERPQRWRRMLMDNESLRKTWLKGAGVSTGKPNEKAIKKAFAKANAKSALKKKPLGFSADHRDIELLKLRNYTMHKKIPDSVFTDADGQDQLVEMLRALEPFISHLNRIVMPDPGDDSDSEEGEDDGDEKEEDEDEEENRDEDAEKDDDEDELTIDF
ncbi:hypothetical protein Sste5346_009375 [Sporothrix stenoceras]|uniref:DUF2461 domain containing protein n=1 Tax=Sporothrix stenoceras TaxID=5173 RepID=A0ABR3YKR1_9PEZI